jgi:hypothetical protein
MRRGRCAAGRKAAGLPEPPVRGQAARLTVGQWTYIRTALANGSSEDVHNPQVLANLDNDVMSS